MDISMVVGVGMSRVYRFPFSSSVNFYLINNVLFLEKLGNIYIEETGNFQELRNIWAGIAILNL
jgi:hypothetical protein